MSFRSRLVASFAGLAIALALLFTVLSEALLRNGLEGEANERLALVASLFVSGLEQDLWPPQLENISKRKKMSRALESFKEKYRLHSALLLLPAGQIIGSRHQGDNAGYTENAEDYLLADGVRLPQALSGTARVSAPLFRDVKGKWVKALYVKMPSSPAIWLRLEAGTRLLGAVARLRQRLFYIALAVGAPALMVGILLSWSLSRRVGQLQRRLEGSPRELSLPGSDEFAKVGASMDRVLKSLDAERRAKERLHEAKLDQARSISWGVAHELRNPLSGLSLLGELAARKAAEKAPQSEIDELIARMKSEIKRMENIVATILEFARQPEMTIETLDAAACVRKAMVGRRPVPWFEGESLRLRADPKALDIVLGVLLSNASEAAGERGQVKVSLSQGGGEEAVDIKIWDSGEIVAEENRGKIFNPFFTTKPTGFGLGLANAVSLADAMGGFLTLQEDGKTFVLRLEMVSGEKA